MSSNDDLGFLACLALCAGTSLCCAAAAAEEAEYQDMKARHRTTGH